MKSSRGLNGIRGLTNLGLLVLMLVIAVASGSGCGGSGGDSGSSCSGSPLEGSWFGTEERDNGSLTVLQVNVDGCDRITSILQAGDDTGLTGSITLERSLPQGEIYEFVLSDDTEGGFFVDSTFTHATFVDEDFFFGVLQRGATSLPLFSVGDISGFWEGVTVETNNAFEISDVLTSNATVLDSSTSLASINGSFSNGVTFSAIIPFGGFDDRGRWVGSFTTSDSDSGQLRIFISADREFLGTWACGQGAIGPGGCTFAAWR